MKRVVVMALAVLAISACLTACNTVRGFGKDIEKGGQAIEKSTH